MPTQTPAVWPLIFYSLLAIAIVAAIVGLSALLGQRHRERATGIPYESGMLPTGSARLRFSAEFYLIAMFFVIFDLESVLVFGWAVAVRELGWAGYAEVGVFSAVLIAALAYLWRSGGLNWETSHPPQTPRERQGGAL
jgi:NADH-quinone oxidoreductase subunit A